jgi:hypothetical protein
VRTVLERLGTPEEIAAAADPPPPGQPGAASSHVNGLAIASLLLAVLWLPRRAANSGPTGPRGTMRGLYSAAVLDSRPTGGCPDRGVPTWHDGGYWLLWHQQERIALDLRSR